MKCEFCKRTWNGSRTAEKCPFCGKGFGISDDTSEPEIKSVSDAVAKIVSEKGKEVLKEPKVVYAYVADYYHGDEADKKLFRIACDNKLLESGYEILGASSNAQRSTIIKKQYRLLQDSAFLSPDYASRVMDFMLIGLGIKEQIKGSEAEKKKTLQSNNKSTAAKPAAVPPAQVQKSSTAAPPAAQPVQVQKSSTAAPPAAQPVQVVPDKIMKKYITFWKYWLPLCLDLSKFNGNNHYMDFCENLSVFMRSSGCRVIANQGIYPADIVAIACECVSENNIKNGIMITRNTFYANMPNPSISLFSSPQIISIDYRNIVNVFCSGHTVTIDYYSGMGAYEKATLNLKNSYISPSGFAQALQKFIGFIKIV